MGIIIEQQEKIQWGFTTVNTLLKLYNELIAVTAYSTEYNDVIDALYKFMKEIPDANNAKRFRAAISLLQGFKPFSDDIEKVLLDVNTILNSKIETGPGPMNNINKLN